VDEHPLELRKIAYGTPAFYIRNGQTHVQLEGQETELRVFGNHNLLNLHAAYLVCSELGVSAAEFLGAISDFTGAARRLELAADVGGLKIYRDFAHAPSKVKATIEAMKQQFPDKKLIAVLELHTYSSLNAAFMVEYRGAMEKADVACVFYSRHALELKRMAVLPREEVYAGFGKEALAIFNNRSELEGWLSEQDYENACLLLMSSGNYDGLDIVTFVRQLTTA
jgi:UDP-N-acetylmuramate: L-alanyl-gamma-D-glutamyl-meso-diaminopimelate ligase